MVKLKNRRLTLAEVHAFTARRVAVTCLGKWYAAASANAERQIRSLQVDENWATVSQIEGWQQLQGAQNGYVMLVTSLLQGESFPVVLNLNYEEGTLGYKPTGGLTFRRLHTQLRNFMQLEPKVSLRVMEYRPWMRYIIMGHPLPECSALPCCDSQCTYLLGTTLVAFKYVHLDSATEHSEESRM